MGKGHLAGALALITVVGCAPPDDVSRRSASVLNGTDATELPVGVYYAAGCLSPGVFVGPRHFLASPSDCRSPLGVVVAGSLRSSTEPPLEIVAEHEGPATGVMAPDGTELRLWVFVLDGDAPVTPAPLADALPGVDDELVLAGYGGRAGEAWDTPNEGAVRVTEVNTQEFSFEGVGDVRACTVDAPVFDSAGAVVGHPVLGSMDPVESGCFSSSVALAIAPARDFIETAVAMELPDGGPPPMPDAGTVGGDDAGPGAVDAGAGGDTGGGGGCTVGSRGAPPAFLAFVALALWLIAARRVRRGSTRRRR